MFNARAQHIEDEHKMDSMNDSERKIFAKIGLLHKPRQTNK